MNLPHLVRPSDVDLAAPGGTQWFSEQLLAHGALLFKGFGINSPEDFESMALSMDPDLFDQYRGTAPRNAKTRYVFSSTELGGMLPIPQHIEMSFLPGTPKRLFFYCHVPPVRHGETPIVDFRKVYKGLDPSIRAVFEEKGIRHIRNYNPPEKRIEFDLSKLKTWDKVYGTKDPAEIERKCEKEEQAFEFRKNRSLKLVNKGPAVRTHPVSGEKVWFNHAQVFHPEGPVLEAERVAQRQGGLRQRGFAWFLRGFQTVAALFLKDELRGTQVTFGDGSPIPSSYIRHIQEVIWDHMVFFPWEEGDMLAIDNYAVAHGRMPFKGPRQIMVAWTQ